MTPSMGSMPRGQDVTALCSRGGRSSNRHKPALGLIISEASDMSVRLKSSKDKGSTCQDQVAQPDTTHRHVQTRTAHLATLTSEAWSEGRKLPRQGVLTEALVQLEWTQVDPEDGRPAFDVRGA